MNSVLIAHLKLQQPAGGAEPQQLMRRQAEMLLDLYRYLRRLSNLCHGELRTTWVARADAIWLRLGLVPRKQGLLFDPLVKSRSRPVTLLDEADLLRKELLALPMYAKQAAAGFREWAAGAVPTPLDPMHEIAYRRSKTQWIMETETGQRCLDFPEVERYTVDVDPCQVTGLVCAVSMRAVELRAVTVDVNSAPELKPLWKGALRIVPRLQERGGSQVASALSRRLHVGEVVTLEVLLHRCVVSHRVIGAMATTLPNEQEANLSTEPVDKPVNIRGAVRKRSAAGHHPRGCERLHRNRFASQRPT